jgi:hypothetical protein
MIIPSSRPGPLFVLGLSIYVLVLATGIALLVGDGGPPAPAIGVLAAVLSAAAAVLMLVDGPLRIRRQEGVERLVLRQSTSIAFFVVMAGALTLGLLDAFTDLAAITPWVLWAVGMATWRITSRLLQRRIS